MQKRISYFDKLSQFPRYLDVGQSVSVTLRVLYDLPIPQNISFERHSRVLMIRLARVGARKQPHYRIVVIEKDRARNGRSVEVVGTYNPRTNPATVELKRDRIAYWTGNGAQLSERVGKLLANAPAAPSAVDVEPVAA